MSEKLKSAEDWAREPFDKNNDIYLTIQKQDFKLLVQQIQLTAYKAGMRRAAEHIRSEQMINDAENSEDYAARSERRDCVLAILTLANTIKESEMV